MQPVNEPMYFRLNHPAGDSTLFLQIEDQKGKAVITDKRFFKGNVVDLMAVRRAINTAQKKFSGR